MSTATQYNPDRDLNAKLIATGLSKTVYALVTPDTEAMRVLIPAQGYREMFREAWMGKQDDLHEDFFTKWLDWSSPVVDLDPALYPFYYPTAGASEPLRQIIFNIKAHPSSWNSTIFFFKGEYEGYKAMAEAANLPYTEVPREDWRSIRDYFGEDDMFFISQPSALDGNVWKDFNEFVGAMPKNSVVADVTYVGAIPEAALMGQKFNLNAPSIRNIVFSLSKPFGAYYDRIGGCFSREEDLGLFGNKWFKNLTSIRYGTILMEQLGVFALPEIYGRVQERAIEVAREVIDPSIEPSDVYILGHGKVSETALSKYLQRGDGVRVCLTPHMAKQIGTA